MADGSYLRYSRRELVNYLTLPYLTLSYLTHSTYITGSERFLTDGRVHARVSEGKGNPKGGSEG